jgi:hypothetical protein
MTVDFMRFAPVSGDNQHPKPGGKYTRDNKREKRLERNRESARKCRRKRKAYVGDLEEKYQGLAEENAMLQLENERLNKLLQQLQNGTGTTLPESSHKRAKCCEFGVSMANDFSESAVPASQQLRLENYSQLATLTTFLLLSAMLTVTTTNLVHCLMTQASVVQQAALVQAERPMVFPCDQRAMERQRNSIVI